MRRGRSARERELEQALRSAAPGWMVTYSDLVTLILVFFVLLFSLSTLDIQRFYAVIAAVQGSFGILDHGGALDPRQPLMYGAANVTPGVRPPSQIVQLSRELREFAVRHNLEDKLQIELEERGVVIRFADQVLFDLGKADLRPESRQILLRLAEALRDQPNLIRVEGHTDNWPIHNEEFPSNWELSTRRATTVVRYLIERGGLAPQRFSAVGYGEYRPLRPNDTEENRAINRRVDIVLLRTDVASSEAGAISQ